MRMRRMASAAAPKKCARPSNFGFASPTSRSQASYTSAVGCSVWPGDSRHLVTRQWHTEAEGSWKKQNLSNSEAAQRFFRLRMEVP